MVGFSEDPAWGKTCTPGKSSNTGPYSERSAWDNACTSASFIPPPPPCPRLTEDIDLATLTLSHGIKIIGSGAEQSGYSVSGVGDIDGDGYADFIIGAPEGDGLAFEKSYLIYGSASPLDITLSSLGSAGIIIYGKEYSPGKLGWSVSGVGDVNNDGFDDFIIGAPNMNSNAGKSYLIFGNDIRLTSIHLDPLFFSSGIIINGDGISSGKAGYSVSGAGDVDGDGKADFIIGAPEFNSNVGISYLIYGDTKANLGNTIELGSLGAKGIVITGDTSYAGKAGFSVSGAGKVNNDNYADFIIGAPDVDSPPDGRSYLILGNTKANLPSTIDINTEIGTYGITITGPGLGGERVGYSVSGAGNVNGDDFDDFIIGAPQGASTGGISYLIYGSASPSNINLDSPLGAAGITITGSGTEQAGTSVSGAGDMDKDGYADFIIGAPVGAEGKSYLIYGSALPSDIILSSLGSAGITITGVSGDQSGFSVSNAGDVNNNGCTDLIIGAPTTGTPDAGESYIIFG